MIIQRFILKNRAGSKLVLTNIGATVCSLTLPDRLGRFANVVLGYPRLKDYLDPRPGPYLGSTIGRVANRIAGAKFKLDGATHHLEANQGSSSLHGGRLGFHKVVWDAKPIKGKAWRGIRFSRLSPAGEGGYPGNLRVSVDYRLGEDNSLVFEAWAVTDQATPVNLCNHNYYNLGGESSGDVLSHKLWINAERYTPMRRGLIPSGRLAPVAGTPFDFRLPKAVGKDLKTKNAQLVLGSGYDHNFVLKKTKGPRSLSLAATLHDPRSGRFMKLWTSEPGLQFYSGNKLPGRPHGRHAGLCLETQHFPNSPNEPKFSSVILRPGKTYHTKTRIQFSVK